jgi:hypothetical protein
VEARSRSASRTPQDRNPLSCNQERSGDPPVEVENTVVDRVGNADRPPEGDQEGRESGHGADDEHDARRDGGREPDTEKRNRAEHDHADHLPPEEILASPEVEALDEVEGVQLRV